MTVVQAVRGRFGYCDEANGQFGTHHFFFVCDKTTENTLLDLMDDATERWLLCCGCLLKATI